MRTRKLFTIGAIAILTAFAIFGFTACGDDVVGGGGDPNLEGTITISPNTEVQTGTELTAAYSGSEAVSYQWKKGTSNVGTDSNKYIPTEAGSYTVTVSAEGYKSKTSTAVAVTGSTIYTVTFNSNGGTTVADITNVASGTIITKPVDPTKAGTIVNVFKGWYKEAGLTNAWDFASDTVTSSITLYAKWDFEYALGDTGPGGGKIFYRSESGFTMTDDNSTAHYLEAAPADMPTELQWTASSLPCPDIEGTETAIGTGRKNTTLILATDTEATAAKACNEYTNNGKSDWFLPSKDEFYELYVNRESVGNMEAVSYWSSSQNMYSDAWAQSFNIIGMQSYVGKEDTMPVRAVRAF